MFSQVGGKSTQEEQSAFSSQHSAFPLQFLREPVFAIRDFARKLHINLEGGPTVWKRVGIPHPGEDAGDSGF